VLAAFRRYYSKGEKMKYISNWVIEENKYIDGLGDVGVVIDGEFASVVSMNCIITDSDHKKLNSIDEEYNNWFKEHGYGLFLSPIQTLKNKFKTRKTKSNEDGFKIIHKKMMDDREAVYAKGEPFINGHRFLIVAAPYAYELLKKYRDTGNIDKIELSTVLNMMEGIDYPKFDSGSSEKDEDEE
jgi:hypothetical protein